MPSSTVWLSRPHELENGRRTPPRPSIELIERLSPECEPGPAIEDKLYRWNGSQEGAQLQGLGLSYDTRNENYVFHGNSEVYTYRHAEAHVWHEGASTNGDFTYETAYSRTGLLRPHTRDGVTTRKPRGKIHTRSGSTIDDLASAAIATSPTFLNGSSPKLPAERPATSYVHSHEFPESERPAKRIRSEKLPAHEWSPSGSRFDINESSSDLMLEAELLLGLRNVVDFKHGTGSPPNKQPTAASAPQVLGGSVSFPLNYNNSTTESLTRSIAVSPSVYNNTVERSMQSPRAPSVEPLEDDLNDIVDSPADVPAGGSESVQDIKEEADSSRLEGVVQQKQSSAVDPAPDSELHQSSLENPRTDKQPKRIKPEIQAEVCAKCHQLQRASRSEADVGIPWIKCNPCGKWYHAACVGFKDDREIQAVDKFVCFDCEATNGPTTFVRKSSRVRTAIDYAELNQGLVKSSADTYLHHWVQPIKDGRITFKAENFARIRPELVTADFFDYTDGMKQPIVIPACWNPRPGSSVSSQIDSLNYNPGMNQTPQLDTDTTEVAEDLTQQTEVIDCGQDLLDMVLPQNLTVRAVADMYGPEETLIVIDVKKQESENHVWTLARWADYYESTDDKPVRNVISLEVSQSTLGRLIRRPRYVREMDLQDLVVPENVRLKSVQFYCLMSVADSYTDFHIDFGGSSVYYHILKGKKTFFFIPPEEKNMKKYEDWNNSPTQNETFLGDLTGDCTRVDLSEGDTMLIPSGWIHAVWTPEDSLVIGGNFLTRTDYPMQFRVVEAEINTKVGRNFRYPFFAKLMWYTLLKYLEDDPIPLSVLEDFASDEDFVFLRADPIWLENEDTTNAVEPGEPQHNSRFYPKSEVNGLASLRDYLLRSARIASELPVTPAPSKEASKAVRSSIPKGHGEPMDLIREFAVWCAWKIGNVHLPEWVREDPSGLAKLVEKLDKSKKVETSRGSSERGSLRRTSQFSVEIPRLNGNSPAPETIANGNVTENAESDHVRNTRPAKVVGNGPKRVACSPCRKRRIRCDHKEEVDLQCAYEAARPRSQSDISVEIPPTAAIGDFSGSEAQIHDASLASDGPNSVNLNLTQEALANTDPRSHDSGVDVGSNPPPLSKKGRNKACETCRKSKRRCVHDEAGNVDPAKAEEPSKPRGSLGKRTVRAVDEIEQLALKKQKLDGNATLNSLSYNSPGRPSSPDIDSLIDPALLAQSSVIDDSKQPSLADVGQLMQRAVDAMEQSAQEMIQNEELQRVSTQSPGEDTVNNPANPAGTPNSRSDAAEQQSAELHIKIEATPTGANSLSSPLSSMSPALSTTTIENEAQPSPSGPNRNTPRASVEYVVREAEGAIQSPVSVSRHSSRQSKAVDRYVPDDTRPTPKPSRVDRRASSSVSSGQTAGSSEGKSRRSSSHTSATTHHVNAGPRTEKPSSRASSARPGSSGSGGVSGRDVDPDEAFARALQAQEHGLRRRASVRI